MRVQMEIDQDELQLIVKQYLSERHNVFGSKVELEFKDEAYRRLVPQPSHIIITISED